MQIFPVDPENLQGERIQERAPAGGFDLSNYTAVSSKLRPKRHQDVSESSEFIPMAQLSDFAAVLNSNSWNETLRCLSNRNGWAKAFIRRPTEYHKKCRIFIET